MAGLIAIIIFGCIIESSYKLWIKPLFKRNQDKED